MRLSRLISTKLLHSSLYTINIIFNFYRTIKYMNKTIFIVF